MKWLTWEHVGVDRMASAWLIRRFIDAGAEFQFIPYGAKPLPEDGEPYDIPGAKLSHRRGRCTFSTMLREFALQDPVLHRIARIIDEADTVTDIAVEAAAPGLDLICRGIRLAARDDIEAIERGSMIFDALYAQLSVDPNGG